MGFSFQDPLPSSIAADDATLISFAEADQSDHAHDAVKVTATTTKESIVASESDRSCSTIFVGNVDLLVSTDKKLQKEFKSLFSPFGEIKSLRFRSIAFSSKKEKVYKKSAFLNQNFNSELKSTCNAYIVYSRLESIDSVKKLNGTLFQGLHLRVDSVDEPTPLIAKQSIFIGNVPTGASEEQIWDLFSEFGSISNVRLVRDKISLVGKGFGFVEFTEKSSVSLALKVDNLELDGRNIRIQAMQKASKNSVAVGKRLKKKQTTEKGKKHGRAGDKEKSSRKSLKTKKQSGSKDKTTRKYPHKIKHASRK